MRLILIDQPPRLRLVWIEREFGVNAGIPTDSANKAIPSEGVVIKRSGNDAEVAERVLALNAQVLTGHWIADLIIALRGPCPDGWSCGIGFHFITSVKNELGDFNAG